MSLVLGFDNSSAGPMLKANGQLCYLVETPVSSIDPVQGSVQEQAPISTPLNGYPFPASAQYASYYNFANVQSKDVFWFVEAIKEPTEAMKLQANEEVFAILDVRTISKGGIAKLFIVHARK